MGEIFSAFGVDWRLLAIQAVNFGLLLLVLWKFLYRPLLGVIDARRERVAEGVRDAEAAAQLKDEIVASRAAVLSEAGKEADALAAAARAAAADKERIALLAAEAKALALLRDAEMQSQDLKAQALAESKQEVAKLVVLGMEKMMANK